MSQAGRGRGPCLRQPRGTSAQPPALTAGGGLGGGGVSAAWTPPNSPAHVPLTVLSSRRPEAAVSAVPSPAPARSPWRLLPKASRVRRVGPPVPAPRRFDQWGRPSALPAPPLVLRGPMAPPGPAWSRLPRPGRARMGPLRRCPRCCGAGSGCHACGLFGPPPGRPERRGGSSPGSYWLGGSKYLKPPEPLGF